MFLTCKAFSPGTRDRGFGRTIDVSSNTFDLVIPGFVQYVASKAGVIGLTRGLATELGEFATTVNRILPRLMRTAHIEARWAGSPVLDHVAAQQAIKRPGLPADLEGAVSFLGTEDDSAARHARSFAPLTLGGQPL